MAQTYSSPKIARALNKHFGNRTTTVRVTMKHAQTVGRFVQKVEAAQQSAANSKLVFR